MKDLLSYLGSWKRKKSTVSQKSFMNKFLWDPRWSPSPKELQELKTMFDKKRALRRKMLRCTDRDEWVRLKQQKDLYLIPNLGYRHELMGVHVGDPYCLEEAHREEENKIPIELKEWHTSETQQVLHSILEP